MDFLIRLCAIFRLSFVRRILFFSLLDDLLSVQNGCSLPFQTEDVALRLNILELTARRMCEYLILIHLHSAQTLRYSLTNFGLR